MGSIPVAGAKKGESQSDSPFLAFARRTHPRAPREIGFAFCEQSDLSSLKGAARKNIRQRRNSLRDSPLLPSSRKPFRAPREIEFAYPVRRSTSSLVRRRTRVYSPTAKFSLGVPEKSTCRSKCFFQRNLLFGQVK